MITITIPIYFTDMYGNMKKLDPHVEYFTFDHPPQGWQWFTVNADSDRDFETYEECVQDAISFARQVAFEKEERIQNEYGQSMYTERNGYLQRELA